MIKSARPKSKKKFNWIISPESVALPIFYSNNCLNLLTDS